MLNTIQRKLKITLDSTVAKALGCSFVTLFILFMLSITPTAVEPVDAIGLIPREMPVKSSMPVFYAASLQTLDFHKIARAAVPGNFYEQGQCVWFLKEARPEIPNSWGNANTWFERAKSDGWEVGQSPRMHAIATTTRGKYGHVALVIGINGDKIHLREMNVKGVGVISEATDNASDYSYIY